MPVRSFACESCEMEWDQLVGLNEEVNVCPNCGADKVKQTITGAPQIRSSEPWYNTQTNKWERDDPLSTKHSTQMDIGYKPIESSRVKEFDNLYPVPVYGEYEKSVSVLQKVDYDPKEIKRKGVEFQKKMDAKGATVSVPKTPKKTSK